MTTSTLLTKHLTAQVSTLLNNSSYIHKMKTGALSKNQFRLFPAQRVPMGKGFIDLLKLSVALCKAQSAGQLQLAFQDNIDDELGLHGKHEPHSAWKKDYLEALQIDTSRSGFKVLPSVTKVVSAYEKVLQNRNLQEISGILMALEFIIPKEYKAVAHSRDLLFPENFVINSYDSKVVRKTKNRACLYLNDHIHHDEKVHFKNIVDSISQIARNDIEITAIKEGMNAVIRLRKSFYYELEGLLHYNDDELVHYF